MVNRVIQIIANPSAGQEGLNLKTVQSVLSEFPVDWDIQVTKQAGDAGALAKTAAESGADVVAIYGGDGSVAEAAGALRNTDTALAILPGGTANVMSVELAIPARLEDALRIAADPDSRTRIIDLGVVNDRPFVLRVGVGLEAEMVAGADRTAKDRYGVFAYLWSALQNLTRPPSARYQLTIDGLYAETEGMTCIIANSGNMGQGGLNLIPGIAVDDGLLDVVVIGQTGIKTFFELTGSILGLADVQPEQRSVRYTELGQEIRSTIQYWQGREVSLICEPRQMVQSDGELLDSDTINCRVLPGALRVLVPAAT